MPGQQHDVTFRFLAEPGDANFGGKVHGGMVMKWIDQAGYACAVDVLARNPAHGEQRLATSCVIVFVALDGPDGKPAVVPAWEPRDDTERGLQDYARRLIEVSRRMQQEVGGMRPPLRADGGHD